MHTPLQKYFAQRVKNLFNHLHDFDLNGDEISLHDFRVEMKKLRSILKFLREVYPKQKLKKPAHLLRTVFQSAGEIREYQLLQQWLEKQECKVIEQKYFPKDDLHLKTEVFRQRSESYKDDLKEIIASTNSFIDLTNEILAEQYVVELNAQIERMCRHNLPVTEWHELRKIIKQWMYAINWVKQDEDESDENYPNFSFNNKLQEAIGQWHDLEIIKDSFSERQIYLSQDIDVQKEFSVAWEKLQASLKYHERKVEDMLNRQPVQVEK
jgi:CHAD domain-containing protein